jgi:hypothetical protein
MNDCASRNEHAATTRATGTLRSHADQTRATTSVVTTADPRTIKPPNINTPRAMAGRPDPQYSFHERTIRVSWPHSATTARNDMALKMIASEPKAAGSICREANANIAKPRIEAANLIASAAALPLSASTANTDCSILLIMILRKRSFTGRQAEQFIADSRFRKRAKCKRGICAVRIAGRVAERRRPRAVSVAGSAGAPPHRTGYRTQRLDRCGQAAIRRLQ